MRELFINPRTNAILTGLFIFLMIISSSVKGNSVPESYVFTLDKFLHIIEYYIFGTLLFFIFLSSSKTPDLISLILGVFYSLIDELYQSTVIGRDASALDVLADIIGLILSILFIKLFFNSLFYDR